MASGIIRRAREGGFPASGRDRMLAALQHDLPALAVVEMIPDVTAEARIEFSRIFGLSVPRIDMLSKLGAATSRA